MPAWKVKAAPREAGLLGRVEATDGRVRDVWEGASEWDRDAGFLTGLAGSLGLTADQVDQLFREAEAIRG